MKEISKNEIENEKKEIESLLDYDLLELFTEEIKWSHYSPHNEKPTKYHEDFLKYEILKRMNNK